MRASNYLFLSLLLASTLLVKWLIFFISGNNSILVGIIQNLKDIQYFPLVISFSEFNISPTYLDEIKSSKQIPFPIYGIIIHAITYKLFGVYSFIILEFILQFIFLIIFFRVINKIFNDDRVSLTFCYCLFTFYLFLPTLLNLTDLKYFELIFNTLDENIGTRFPRPLFTGIIIFLFLYYIFDLKKYLINFDFYYYLKIVILLSILLNSFFYYFIIFSLLFIFLFLKDVDKKLLDFLRYFKLKIFYLFIFFIILSSPFFFQLYLGEEDYSQRIGVININLSQKFFLIEYYLLQLIRLDFLIIFLPCLLIFIVTQNKYKNQIDSLKKINVLFYLVVTCIVSPIIFFLVSPKIVSIYHFLGILKFLVLFYLLVSCYYLIIVLFKTKISKYYIEIIIISLFLNIFYSYINNFSVNPQTNSLNEVQKIFEKNNFQKSKNKIFTNDLKIMNLWLLNKNNELAISDGFTSSLKNKQIEFNFINNLKYFKIGNDQFKKIISYNNIGYRNKFLMMLFIYRYQANSLYTFSDIDNYEPDVIERIKKTSPFRAQSQIIPNDEKKRFLKMFDEVIINESLVSNLVVIKKDEIFSDFKIKNKTYKLIYSDAIYDIYYKLN